MLGKTGRFRNLVLSQGGDERESEGDASWEEWFVFSLRSGKTIF